jgi:hypothetical protein
MAAKDKLVPMYPAAPVIRSLISLEKRRILQAVHPKALSRGAAVVKTGSISPFCSKLFELTEFAPR